MCVYNHDVPNNKRSISKKCIYLFRFFILFSMTACTHLSPPLQCRRRRLYDDNDLSYDSIRFRYFSFRFFILFFLIILVVLVAAEVFLPIIFFVNWLGSHAARVSRRRRRNELADRLPPSSTLPFAMSLLVALTVSHSFSQSLYLSLSLSLSLVRILSVTAVV